MSLIVSEVYDALIEAGASEAKAKAAAGSIPLAEQLATKDALAEVRADLKEDIAEVRTDLAEVRTDLAEVRTDLAGLEARLYRQLWVMAAGIVGLTVTFVKLLA